MKIAIHIIELTGLAHHVVQAWVHPGPATGVFLLLELVRVVLTRLKDAERARDPDRDWSE